MTKDEVGLGKLVDRLQPLHTADEPIARAVVSTDQAERLLTVEAYLLANNALKREAADAITALIAERDALAKALEPFAVIADAVLSEAPPDATKAKLWNGVDNSPLFISLDACRLARSTLNLTVKDNG